MWSNEIFGGFIRHWIALAPIFQKHNVDGLNLLKSKLVNIV
jgi:hypothetical protein